MAGVVAMASVIEDFDTQPRSESQKDGNSPVAKRITNYFSPVPKPMEKLLSPPRSNKIMDYFCPKTQFPKGKVSPPKQSPDNYKKPKIEDKQAKTKLKRQVCKKRGNKSGKAAGQVVPTETVSSTDDGNDCVIVEASKSKESETDPVVNDSIDCDLVDKSFNECNELSKSSSKLTSNGKVESTLTTTNSPISHEGKTAVRNERRKQLQHSDSEEKREECDVPKQVDNDEAECENESTVKISFEDFLRSQKRNEENMEHTNTDICCEGEDLKQDQTNYSKVEESKDSELPAQQISPRTVTVRAEVHVISSIKEPVGKVASIFNQKKRLSATAEATLHSPTETGHGLLSPSVKLKSNVVLQEEDLELFVLESDSTPKCSLVERKQFMAAFKQPTIDGTKTKPGKQKEPAEKISNASKDDTILLPHSTAEETTRENKTIIKKPTKKSTCKATAVQEAATTSAVSAANTPTETLLAIAELEKKEEEPAATPVQRRSKRGAVVTQSSKNIETTPVKKNGKRLESKVTSTSASLESPIRLAPSKKRKSKHGVFVAEIINPPDPKESPIRIKFSRVHKNNARCEARTNGEINSSLTARATRESNKRKHAKKLLEKAKHVVEQNKKSSMKEDVVRRSQRSKALIPKSYCEDEDSIICLEDQDSPIKKTKTLKPLRSLNDVLGKAAPAGKDLKFSSGTKLPLEGPEKSAQKFPAVISIFDDSSQDGLENSQDEEQFKARRDFLKSGLPESFKKQIAKTAATKEAYSLSCSTFQPVTHTTQPPHDCPLWNLPWPESSLLNHLKELRIQTCYPPPPVEGFSCVKKAEPSRRNNFHKLQKGRPEFSKSVRQQLTEELKTLDSQFPAERLISHLLKRRTDYQLQFLASEAEPGVKQSAGTPQSVAPVGGKRKRNSNDGDSTVKVTKKQKSSQSEENITTAVPEAQRRGSRLRRSQKLRHDDKEPREEATLCLESPVISSEDSVIVLDDSPLDKDATKKDSLKEDVLWTDKYQPQLCSDIIGNAASVKRLYNWLKEWKNRTDREERKNQKSNKPELSDESDWDGGTEDEIGGDELCNTILITGPTGVGKTTAVYACAQELGFKIFEVNASSQRSGRLILSQLKEATQSHQVDSQGLNATKPSYFNSYGTSGNAGSTRLGSSPRKTNSPRRVLASPRKNPQSPRGARRGGLAPMSLASFFKTGKTTNKESSNIKTEQIAAPKEVPKMAEKGKTKKDLAVKRPAVTAAKEKSSEEKSKKTATSLILFEEVDVIFDDDFGFLAAIKTFMATTKRPVILTTSDPFFSSIFDGNFEEIHFKRTPAIHVGSYLQLLCLAENVRTDPSDIQNLLQLNNCDVRQSLLQLQFWTRSTGGRQVTETHMCADKSSKEQPGGTKRKCVADSPALPLCEKGCAESQLGLLNIEPHRDIWEQLRNSPNEAMCWELLTESRQRGVDLLYSNLEALLPLPHTVLTTSKLFKPEACSSAQKEQQFVDTQQQEEIVNMAESAESDSCSPIKVSGRMRKNKKRRCPGGRGRPLSESDSEDGFLSLCAKQTSTILNKEEVKKHPVSNTATKKLLTPEQQKKSVPVTQCLESLADFLDDMSYIDSSLHTRSRKGTVMSQGGAIIKDGMTDESRVEIEKMSWPTEKRVSEIQATVEALSFQKCVVSATNSWEKVQRLDGELGKEARAELSMPVAAHRKGYTFTQESHCLPQLVQQRRELMECLVSGGTFGILGNRQAMALDYLPAIRSICRAEQLKEQGKVKRRFLHYLDAIHFGLDKTTLQFLAEDF